MPISAKIVYYCGGSKLLMHGGSVIFGKRRKAQHYVVDLKRILRISDTKKAGCGDRLFLCVRPLERKTKRLIGFNSSGLFVHTQ